MKGGCITRLWEKSLCFSENILDLMSAEPDVIPKFERLYTRHGQRIPKTLRWGEMASTNQRLDAHRTASIVTTCIKGRGLHSSCFYVSDGRRR